jgi:hypothetical protein
MEETDKEKIVDQALTHPIKYTLMLTKEVFSLNKGLFLAISAIVVLLSLLSNIPILGLIASVLSGILMFALFFFVGKVFYEAEDMDTFVEAIRTMRLSELWNRYWKASFGAYLGWVLVVLLYLLIAGLILGIAGAGNDLMMASEGNDPMAMLALLPATILPLILLALLLYVTPLVFANIIKTDTFNDAFKAVFSIFSKDIWRRAFTGAYFKYMTLLGLILIALTVLMVVLAGAMMAIFSALSPSLMIVGMIIVVILMVVVQIVMNIFYAISSVIADRMTR